MNIKMNSVMKRMLEHFGVNSISLDVIPDDLDVFEDIVKEGIVEEGGCILLRQNLSQYKNSKIKDFPDLTGYECFINKIHVDDYLNTSDPKVLLEYTLRLAQYFVKQLAKFNEKIQIVIGFQLDDILTSSIRFHKVRNNEFWLNSNLESYKEGILAWEVN